MTDVVERLRAIKKLPLDLQAVTEEAAVTIEFWRKEHDNSREIVLSQKAEIEQLRKWIEQLQYEVKNYADENAKLREALEVSLRANETMEYTGRAITIARAARAQKDEGPDGDDYADRAEWKAKP